MKTIVKLIHRLNDNSIRLEMPYHARFIEDLKASIEPKYREYDPGTRTWSINDDYQDILEDLLDIYMTGAQFEWSEE
jgi:hypothetical protein